MNARNQLRSKTFRRMAMEPYLFVMPALIYMVGLIGYAFVYNVLLGFQNVEAKNLTQEKTFVGMQNYIDLINEYELQDVLVQTLQFTLICIVLQFLLGLILALFFNNAFIVSKIARGAMMVSYVLPVIATALLFKYMFNSDSGILDKIFMSIGLTSQPMNIMNDPGRAMWGPIISDTWKQVPYNMLLLLTGIITIPSEINESASMDGANVFQRLFYITIPLLKKTMLSVLMLGFLNTFKVFDLIFSMTGGGPLGVTEVLSTLSYNLSFTKFQFSLGAATANILFLCLLVIALFYNILIKKEDD